MQSPAMSSARTSNPRSPLASSASSCISSTHAFESSICELRGHCSHSWTNSGVGALASVFVRSCARTQLVILRPVRALARRRAVHHGPAARTALHVSRSAQVQAGHHAARAHKRLVRQRLERAGCAFDARNWRRHLGRRRGACVLGGGSPRQVADDCRPAFCEEKTKTVNDTMRSRPNPSCIIVVVHCCVCSCVLSLVHGNT
jgi:hypothetical protein